MQGKIGDFDTNLRKMPLDLVCCFAATGLFFAPVLDNYIGYFGVIPWLIFSDRSGVRFYPARLVLSVVLWSISLFFIPRLLKHLDSSSYVD